MGDWSLHLAAVEKMIPLFAATGHNNYAKSERLYLQLMRDLHVTYPDTQLFSCERLSQYSAQQQILEWTVV